MTEPTSRPKSAAAQPGTKPDAPADPKDELKTLPITEVEQKLGSSPDGLTQAEAAKRLTKDGPNEIAAKKDNPLLKLLTYFWGPIPWMIEGAVILSGVVQHWLDFGIILLLLISNAVVGFWEERQAGNAIAVLKAELAGDSIQVDESALTGESLPATRKPGEAVYSGSIMRRGEIDALVYATGTHTFFGKTAQLVEEAHTVSHFQKAVLKIGNYLIVLAVVLAAVIVTVAIFRGDPILTTLEFALVLLVAAIPVAMPTDPHAWPVLVDPPRQAAVDRRTRHADSGNIDRGLRAVHDADWVESGTFRVGICTRLGARQRSRQAARIPSTGSHEGRALRRGRRRAQAKRCRSTSIARRPSR